MSGEGGVGHLLVCSPVVDPDRVDDARHGVHVLDMAGAVDGQLIAVGGEVQVGGGASGHRVGGPLYAVVRLLERRGGEHHILVAAQIGQRAVHHMDGVIVSIVNTCHIVDGEGVGNRTNMVQNGIAGVGRLLAARPGVPRGGHGLRGQGAAARVDFDGRRGGQCDLALGDVHGPVHQTDVVAAAHLLVRGRSIRIDTQHGAGGDAVVVVAGIHLVNAVVEYCHYQGILVLGGAVEHIAFGGGHRIRAGNHGAVGSDCIVAGIMIVAVILAVVGCGCHGIHIGVAVEDNRIENGVARALARRGLVVDAHRVSAHAQVLDSDHIGSLCGGYQTG